jgi:hypothetical protein
VINFLIDDVNSSNASVDRTIVVNGVVSCCLGHGLTGEVIGHNYFASWEKVCGDLKTMVGWKEGKVVLHTSTGGTVKDPISGLVCRMEQGLEEAGPADVVVDTAPVLLSAVYSSCGFEEKELLRISRGRLTSELHQSWTTYFG